MFAGCWQIMRAYWQLIRAEGVGYWQLIRAGNRDVCRSCDLCFQVVTATFLKGGLNDYGIAMKIEKIEIKNLHHRFD
jgi:hypothetical protein